MSSLCRFVLPTALSPTEEACVTEFNEYKKRMKEISQQKSLNKRLTNTTGGLTTNSTNIHDSSHHQKDSIRNPEQAKEEAKKLVQSGAIKVQAQGKDQGFKRATSSNSGQERIVKKMGLTPNTSSPLTSNQTNPFQPIPFISPTSTSKFVQNNSSHDNKRRVVNYDDTDNY